MILRVLILIFAFNAFIPSALAMGINGICKEMDNTSSTMMMSHGDSSMTCNMSDMDKSCSDTLCASGCLTSITTALPYDAVVSISLTSTTKPLFQMAYFYQIYPNINTPPPLV